MENLEKVKTAKKTLAGINSAAVEIKQLGADLVRTAKDLDSIMKELEKIPSCPTCDRPLITQDHINSHI
jgi:hypothetical protein